jgi:hypothetical protein
VFIFRDGSGQDIVTDFTVGADLLQIQLRINGLAVATPEDLASRVHRDGAHAVIDLGNGDTITLLHVQADAIQNNPEAYFAIG